MDVFVKNTLLLFLNQVKSKMYFINQYVQRKSSIKVINETGILLVIKGLVKPSQCCSNDVEFPGITSRLLYQGAFSIT